MESEDVHSIPRPMNAAWRNVGALGILLATAASYFLLVPLAWPRGPYASGHYRLRDVYLGVPLLAGALAVLAVRLAPPRSRRELALGLVSLWIAVVGTTLLFDAGCAAFRMRWDVEQPDPELAWIRRPRYGWTGPFNRHTRNFTFQADENGFRNPPGLAEADIVFIGDSFTEGAGVPDADTFCRRVGRETGLRTVNLGRSGYSPPQEAIVLRRYGLRYRPRVVVWQIYEGNDLSDSEYFQRWKEGGASNSLSLMLRYVNASPLCRWLSLTLPAPAARLRTTGGEVQTFLLTDSYDPDLPAHRPLGVALVKDALREGGRLCADNGVRLVVVAVPLSVRVLAPHMFFDGSAQAERYLPGGRVQAPDDFAAVFRRHCKALGLPFVDLFPALERRARVENRQLFFSGDMHFDVDGHAVAAAEISQWLSAAGLVGGQTVLRKASGRP